MWELLKDLYYWLKVLRTKMTKLLIDQLLLWFFKRLILWIEGTEDENDFDINWSTAYMEAFKRLILWIEGTEDEKDLDINWNCICGTFKRLMQYNFSVTRVEKIFYFHQTGKAIHKSQKLKQSSFTEFNCRHYQSQFVLLSISLFYLHW